MKITEDVDYNDQEIDKSTLTENTLFNVSSVPNIILVILNLLRLSNSKLGTRAPVWCSGNLAGKLDQSGSNCG